MEAELSAITLDERPRPRMLGVDRMFDRASDWKSSKTGDRTVVRTASPPRYTAIYPLPLPITTKRSYDANEDYIEGQSNDQISPLAKLFDYPELCPHVLQHFVRPAELAVISRVCRTWNKYTRRALYRDIWVRPWDREPKHRVKGLFQTLSMDPELCNLVRSLEIRFFPLDLTGNERIALEDQVSSAVAEMFNLERLVWTRDKSLSAGLFETITSLPRIRYLELSGHSQRYFDPRLICDMPALEDLRIMMPDPQFRNSLVQIVRALDKRRHEREVKGGLKGFAIVYASSTSIDDPLLKALAPHLSALRRLQLVGCRHATREGVYAILDAAPGITELTLDALPHSGLRDLSDAPALASLRTLSLSFDVANRHSKADLTTAELPVLPPQTRLRALDLTLSGVPRTLSCEGLAHLAAQTPFGVLERLTLLNLVISASTLQTILRSAPDLRELYIAVSGPHTLHNTHEAFAATKLQVFHANAPPPSEPKYDDLARLASQIPTLEQVGALTRVYEVHRRYDGDTHVVQLTRWSQTITPGYFQVWRP